MAMTSLFGFTSPAVKRLLGWKQGLIFLYSSSVHVMSVLNLMCNYDVFYCTIVCFEMLQALFCGTTASVLFNVLHGFAPVVWC